VKEGKTIWVLFPPGALLSYVLQNLETQTFLMGNRNTFLYIISRNRWLMSVEFFCMRLNSRYQVLCHYILVICN